MEANASLGIGPTPTLGVAALTVYYDAVCPVRSSEIAAYRRQAGSDRCVWVDASSCPESALGAGLSGDTALARFHVCRADGALFGGAGGFADLWHVMPRLKRAGRIALLRLFSGLLDTAYSVFLRVRPLWQSTRTAPTSKEQT